MKVFCKFGYTSVGYSLSPVKISLLNCRHETLLTRCLGVTPSVVIPPIIFQPSTALLPAEGSPANECAYDQGW